MLRTAIRRTLLAIPTLLGVTVVVFLLVNVLPGDPAAAILGDNATPAAREQVRQQLGLDEPLPLRYLDWLTRALSGDLGYSPYRQRPVADLLAQAVGNTAALAICSALAGLLGGVALGFIAGRRRGTWIDRVISVFTLSGLSIPSFFLAVVMLMVFAAKLRWFPAAGTGLDVGFVAFFPHVVLPLIAGSLTALAITTRVTRSSIVEAEASDFVQTLRAKGLGGAGIARHVMKNAISPVLTTSGLQVGYLLGGSVLIETIFSWPGIGMLVYNAVSTRDLVVVQGATLVIALTFVIVNLVVDLLQTAIDPRLRRAVR
ncbi:ABC transporter permease [Saccharopolyspora sp. K220]|uniref:ABC transporter permease n=1 Tax=Saccharopolyspora soli TaxID=2926618 RepID=UPI001F5A55EA|nr:ABC transporter permease [Saccharopolyspora soli]MCI2415900.1 ABC transporter permease [Saccharopolyspora soli]